MRPNRFPYVKRNRPPGRFLFMAHGGIRPTTALPDRVSHQVDCQGCRWVFTCPAPSACDARHRRTGTSVLSVGSHAATCIREARPRKRDSTGLQWCLTLAADTCLRRRSRHRASGIGVSVSGGFERIGTEGRTRTDKLLRAGDFESPVSTNSTTPAKMPEYSA